MIFLSGGWRDQKKKAASEDRPWRFYSMRVLIFTRFGHFPEMVRVYVKDIHRHRSIDKVDCQTVN